MDAPGETRSRVAHYAREKRCGGGERKGMRKLKLAGRHSSTGGAQVRRAAMRRARTGEEGSGWESEMKRFFPEMR